MTADDDAGLLTIEVEGRVELLPPGVLPRVVAGCIAVGLTEGSRAARLSATGLTDQRVAEALGVDAEQVRRWDDDAALDAYHDQLADVLGMP